MPYGAVCVMRGMRYEGFDVYMRTPESTPKSLSSDCRNFAIFIQTILANFYPNFLPGLPKTQFLSKFSIRHQATVPLFFFAPPAQLGHGHGTSQ